MIVLKLWYGCFMTLQYGCLELGLLTIIIHCYCYCYNHCFNTVLFCVVFFVLSCVRVHMGLVPTSKPYWLIDWRFCVPLTPRVDPAVVRENATVNQAFYCSTFSRIGRPLVCRFLIFSWKVWLPVPEKILRRVAAGAREITAVKSLIYCSIFSGTGSIHTEGVALKHDIFMFKCSYSRNT